jgi:hypothetical protein
VIFTRLKRNLSKKTLDINPADFEGIYRGLVAHYALLAQSPGFADHARVVVRELIEIDSDFKNIGRDIKKAIDESKKS